MDQKSFFAILIAGTTLFVPVSSKNIEASLEESLALRRISEYWKEKDFYTVKTQIEVFLSRNPESAYSDRLYAMLGDLHFQERNYEEAIAAYDKIQGKEFRLKSQFHKLHSYYETGKRDEFILSADVFLKNPNSSAEEIHTIRFELAESYFHLAQKCEDEKKKTALLKEALAQYQQVMETKYCDLTLIPQAYAYEYLKEHAKAAALYELLSQKEPEKKEDWLFHRASMQLHGDRKGAIETFAAIVELQGKNASRAAFNELNLLFQEKQYKDFILAHDKVIGHISENKLPIVRYFLGRSLFLTKDFAKAISPLSDALASLTLDSSQEKNALLALIMCAKETQDLPLFEKTLDHLKSEFSEEEDTLKCLLMHAQLCREKQEWSKSRATIKHLLEICPEHPQRPALIYDEAVLLSQEGKPELAACAFEAFLEEFPQAKHRLDALRHLVICRQEALKEASVESQKVKQHLLMDALERALSENKTFSTAERKKLRWLLGRMQYELCHYDEAIDTLSEYVLDFGSDSTCAEACLLLAYSHLKGSQDQIHFLLNAERALAYNPELEGALDLRLALFNTYLEIAGNAPIEEKKEVMAKAANHLFLSLDKPINKENQHWLTSYYFQQYQNGQEEAIHRAAAVLEKLLGIQGDVISLSLSDQSLDIEGEAIKLASAYEKAGNFAKRALLLESLVAEQNSHPQRNWKYQRMAEFELGKTYLALDAKEKAIAAFSHLVSTSSHISSYFAIAAQLEKAKLDFSLLNQQEDKEKAISAICDALKDVQIKRKLHSEPLHLEAALSYVDIKTELASQDCQLDCKRFHLLQMRENFSSEKDPLVEEYLSAAEQFPDKENTYMQYLAYVDAEILRLEAEDASDMLEVKTRYEQLLKEPCDATLKARICKSMEALETSL